MSRVRWRDNRLQVIRAKSRGDAPAITRPSADHAPDSPSKLARDVQEIYGKLLECLPTGVQGMTRILRPSVGSGCAFVDLDGLLTWLQLPRFVSGNPACDWVNLYACKIERRSRLPLTRLLEALMEQNAEPQPRRMDARFAAWELEFVGLAEQVVVKA